MPVCCCVCEPPETAKSLGDDTRAVVALPNWHLEHELHTLVCSNVSVRGREERGLRAHRRVLETRTRAEVNVRPRPLV